MGDGVARGRGVCARGESKSLSTSTRCGIGRPAVDELAHAQQASRKLHVETWAGRKQGPDLTISQEVEIILGCAVTVRCPSCLSNTSVSPEPGSVTRNMLGWSQMEKTVGSGVWLFRGALKWENVSSLSAAGDGNAYGQGAAIGPPIGERCWPLLARLWRVIAHLMLPWCAEGDVSTAANLNFYLGAKLIVLVSFGTTALFKWKGKSCPDNKAHLCCLGHGDILVMDGRCQDKYLHCTNPGLEQERIDVTFRWIKQHVASCGMLFANVCAGFISFCY